MIIFLGQYNCLCLLDKLSKMNIFSRHPIKWMRVFVYLCFWQVECFCQFFSFCTNDVLVLLEGLLQFQKLTRTEGRSDSLWFPEREQELRQVRSWKIDNIDFVFSVTRFGEILPKCQHFKVFGNCLKVYLIFVKMFKLLWNFLYSIGHIFVASIG